VLALGNPFGLGGSVTKGILSSKNRRPSSGNEPLNVEDWLQTDAAINPGNSGGPLINLKGELIGLNVAVYREQDGQRGTGVGFSIPIKQVSAALSRFFSPEITHSLWFGAHVKKTAADLVITEIQAASPAQRAGLKPGDTVLQVNGQNPTGLIQFNRLIAESSNHSPRVSVRRGAERLAFQARLVPFPELIRQKLGLSLLEDPAQSASRLGLSEAQGLLIEEVEKAGPAARANVPRGALLANVDGREATDLRTVGQALSEKQKGDSVLLGVLVPRQRGQFIELRQATVELQVR
jgi:S1-C subfamily serine protease